MPRFYNLLQTALLRQTWVRPIDFDVLAARGTMQSKVFEHVPSKVMYDREMHGVCRMTSLTIYLYIYDIYMSYIYQLMLMHITFSYRLVGVLRVSLLPKASPCEALRLAAGRGSASVVRELVAVSPSQSCGELVTLSNVAAGSVYIIKLVFFLAVKECNGMEKG